VVKIFLLNLFKKIALFEKSPPDNGLILSCMYVLSSFTTPLDSWAIGGGAFDYNEDARGFQADEKGSNAFLHSKD